MGLGVRRGKWKRIPAIPPRDETRTVSRLCCYLNPVSDSLPGHRAQKPKNMCPNKIAATAGRTGKKEKATKGRERASASLSPRHRAVASSSAPLNLAYPDDRHAVHDELLAVEHQNTLHVLRPDRRKVCASIRWEREDETEKKQKRRRCDPAMINSEQEQQNGTATHSSVKAHRENTTKRLPS